MKNNLKLIICSIMMAAFILFGVFYLKKSHLDDPNIIWSATLFVAIPLILVLVPLSIFYCKKHGLKVAMAFPIMMTIAVILNNFINSLWISTAIAVMAVICYSILSDRSIRTSWSMAAAIRKNNPGKAINIGEKNTFRKTKRATNHKYKTQFNQCLFSIRKSS